MNWLISANGRIYKHSESFKKNGYVDWRQTAKYRVGDIVYIYSTRPLSKIEFKCVVEKINIESNNITNDEEFWIDRNEYLKSLKGLYTRLRLLDTTEGEYLTLEKLKNNGLKAAPQGPLKINEILLEYIELNFNGSLSDNIYPDQVVSDEALYEGTITAVMVNRYERNPEARKKCIEHHGTSCCICGFNFREVYGEFAKDFIHVHHIVPIATIDSTYRVDYKKDLIPVCPNCHAMLHKKSDKYYLNVDELRKLFVKTA